MNVEDYLGDTRACVDASAEMHFIDLVEHDEKKSILAPPSNMYGLARRFKERHFIKSESVLKP